MQITTDQRIGSEYDFDDWNFGSGRMIAIR